MPRCDLQYSPKHCAEMYRKASARQGHPCNGCETGRERVGAMEPAVEKPAEIIPKSIPGRIPAPEKEGKVDQEKVKENVLRVLGRKGPMAISNLKLFAAAEESKENFHAAVDVLAAEGKVLKEVGFRAGAWRVSLPGAQAPAAPSPKASNAATIPSKTPRGVNRSVNRKSATPPSNSRAKSERPVSAPRKAEGNGVYAAAIADLEARRTEALNDAKNYDTAIEMLRALA